MAGVILSIRVSPGFDMPLFLFLLLHQKIIGQGADSTG